MQILCHITLYTRIPEYLYLLDKKNTNKNTKQKIIKNKQSIIKTNIAMHTQNTLIIRIDRIKNNKIADIL